MKNDNNNSKINQNYLQVHENHIVKLKNVSNVLEEACHELDSIIFDQCLFEVELLEMMLDPTLDLILKSSMTIAADVEDLKNKINKENRHAIEEFENVLIVPDNKNKEEILSIGKMEIEKEMLVLTTELNDVDYQIIHGVNI